MHSYSLAEFVKKALLHTGCDPNLIQELDSHSTVQIDLNDSPSIYVGKLDDTTVIWSDLCEFHESILQHHAERLLREIMSGFAYSRTNQLVLRESEGQLQIYADVAEQYLDDPAAMADAINIFFESQSRLMEIIRQ